MYLFSFETFKMFIFLQNYFLSMQQLATAMTAALTENSTIILILILSPVGWGCRILQLPLGRGVRPAPQ